MSSAVQRLDTLAAQLEKDVATLSRANSYEDDDDDDEGTTPADSKFWRQNRRLTAVSRPRAA